MYSFPDLEPVCFSMSSSNCCFLPAYRFLRRQALLLARGPQKTEGRITFSSLGSPLAAAGMEPELQVKLIISLVLCGDVRCEWGVAGDKEGENGTSKSMSVEHFVRQMPGAMQHLWMNGTWPNILEKTTFYLGRKDMHTDIPLTRKAA